MATMLLIGTVLMGTVLVVAVSPELQARIGQLRAEAVR